MTDRLTREDFERMEAERREALGPLFERLPDHYPGYMISIGRGWYDLVTELDKQLADLDPGYSIYQVKEKFGGLRYYTGSTPNYDPPDGDPFGDLIREAEQKSYTICEKCGAPGKLRDDRSWYSTLCDEHAKGIK